jgi:hypothetical protein
MFNLFEKTMAILLTELIANPKILDEEANTDARCAYCGVLLQETITGNRKAPRGRACSDCYYEEIGKGIEDHPVVSGKVRRG